MFVYRRAAFDKPFITPFSRVNCCARLSNCTRQDGPEPQLHVQYYRSTMRVLVRVNTVVNVSRSGRLFLAVRVHVYSLYLLLRSDWISTLLPSSVIDIQKVGSMIYLIFFSKHCDCILFFALVLSQQVSPSVIMVKIALTICLDHQVFISVSFCFASESSQFSFTICYQRSSFVRWIVFFNKHWDPFYFALELSQ